MQIVVTGKACESRLHPFILKQHEAHPPYGGCQSFSTAVESHKAQLLAPTEN